MSDSQNITSDLKDIVNDFNNKLAQWSEKTGCVASFSWDYHNSKDLRIKAVEKLSLASIDKIIFRSDPISADEIEQVLAKADTLNI